MKRVIVLMIANLLAFNVFSQLSIGDFFKAGPNDGAALAKPYMRPYAEMLGVGLNSGWYTSAKVHGVLGFDVTISGVYIMAPSSAETFDVNDVNLENFELVDGSTSIAPTIIGDKGDRPELIYKDDTSSGSISKFTLPDGTGSSNVVLPMVTVGVGLPYGFEIKGRFLPSTKLGSDIGKVSLWGLGLQKDVKDLIPFVKRVPFLQVSLLAAYTNFSGSADVEDVGSYFENGKLNADANAFTTRLLVGAKLPIIAFYTGIGYGHTSSDYKLDGDFGTYTYQGAEVEISEYMEPIELSYSDSSFDFNVGMRLGLGIFSIYGDYTVGKYSSFIGGIGLGFR